MKRIVAAVLMTAITCTTMIAAAQEPGTADTAAIADLVRTFIDAEVHADAATLRSVTAEQFVEISPLGDVDPRDKWLGFYKEKVSQAKAQFVIEDSVVRQFGDSAILTAKVTFTVPANGTPRTFAARMNFVAHKEGTQWRLVSAQPTPLRPKS